MASSLSGLGTLTYTVRQPLNDSALQTFTFSGPRIRTHLKVEPVFDRAGRTQIYNRYLLTVEGWVAGDENGVGQGTAEEATTMNKRMRAILTQKGGVLTFTGSGHDIKVNDPEVAGSYDCEWGPTPRLIAFEPVGANRTFEIVWEIEFCLAESYAGGAYTLGGVGGRFISLNSTVDYTIDARGLCVREIRGVYRIVNTANTSGQPLAMITSDDYSHRIQPVVPDGWKRTRSHRQISENRSELTYEIVDEELPGDNAFPIGVSDMRLRHRVGTDVAGVLLNCSWTGSASVLLGYPIGIVWERILLIMRQRIEHSRNFPGVQAGQAAVIIRSIEIEEGVIGDKTLDWSMHYMVTCAKKSQMLTASGMFQKVNSTTWAQWNAAMKTTAFTIDGLTGHRYQVKNDVIINPHQQSTAHVALSDFSVVKSFKDQGGSLLNKKPPKSASYLKWVNGIRVTYEHPLVVPNPMSPPAKPVSLKKQQKFPEGGYGDTGIDQADVDVEIIPALTDGRPRIFVRIKGKAVRFGFHTEVPRLAQELLPAGTIKEFALDHYEGERQKVAEWFSVGVYAGWWDIIYRIVTGDLAAMKKVIDRLDDALRVTDEDPNGNKGASE